MSFLLGAGLLATAGVSVGAGTAAANSAAGPPSITRLALGRPELGASGGAATIRLDAQNGETCWFTAPPAVQVSREHRGCLGGRYYTVVRLGPTVSTTALSLPITGWVQGSDGTTIHQSVLIRQRPYVPLQVSVSSSAALGQPYAAQLGVTGGTAPYSLRIVAGSLPPGISLSSSGDLSGTPSAVGTYTATVAMTDASQPQKATTLTVVLRVVGQPVSVTTSVLPVATQGQYYQTTLAASGGTTPYRWSIVSGYLPPGITLQPSGTVSGTPTIPGTYPVTFQVADSSSPVQTATRQLTLYVQRTQLQVTTTSLPTATVGNAYSTALSATGGTPPYTWRVTSGSLPTGVTLSSSGVLQGTPTTTGSYPFGVLVTDASYPQRSATASFTLNVVGGTLTITSPATLTPAVVGTYYSYALVASGGTAPYSWHLIGGSLPPGMFLPVSGVLQGNPTTAGTYSFTVEVVDSASPVHFTTATLSLTVNT